MSVYLLNCSLYANLIFIFGTFELKVRFKGDRYFKRDYRIKPYKMAIWLYGSVEVEYSKFIFKCGSENMCKQQVIKRRENNVQNITYNEVTIINI